MAVSSVRITTALIFAVAPTIVLGSGYEITVRGGNKLAAISFATKEQFEKPCWLEAHKMTLELPTVGPDAGDGTGKIEFATRVIPGKACLQSEGPQRGVIALQTEDGARLPSISFGRYQVVIDGEKYGTLLTTRNTVELLTE